MSRRSTVLSAASFTSPPRSSHSQQNTPGTPYPRIHDTTKHQNDRLNVDPNELFTRHTIAEVRTVQHRLRTDADAKQEELRLMVGAENGIAIFSKPRHQLFPSRNLRDVC